MAQAYTPALQATGSAKVRKLRELPLPGRCLVEVGQRVSADTEVLAADIPGEISILRVADRMGFEVEDVIDGMLVKPGDAVTAGQVIARVKSFFGLFESTLEAPTSGVVEFFTEVNAHLGIRQASAPLAVDAYVEGVVVEVDPGKSVTIEAQGAFIQGIFGVGGEARGKVFALDVALDEVVTEQVLLGLGEKVSSAIVVGGASYTPEALAQAAKLNVQAVVCGSVDSSTLRTFVGHEIGVSITGDEAVPFTFIVTEGFGVLPMSERILRLAQKFAGRQASVNGATQVRAGAMRPEIIIPHTETAETEFDTDNAKSFLEVGARLRVIRVPYFGALGEVVELPSEPQVVPSGAKVRVLRAKLDTGEEVVVPRANVELL